MVWEMLVTAARKILRKVLEQSADVVLPIQTKTLTAHQIVLTRALTLQTSILMVTA